MESVSKLGAVVSVGRDYRMDSVKFFLVLLVIAGHVFGQPPLNDALGCTEFKAWIYVFHMPLFVFISGYFSKKTTNKYFLTSCWRLAEPLVIVQIVIVAAKCVFKGELSIETILTPWWVFWYLLSLLWWRSMLQILPTKIFRNTTLIVVVSFAISLIAGFLPLDRFLSLQRSLAFLPFFCVGYCMRGKNIFLPSKYRLWCALFLILTMFVPLLFGDCLGDLNRADPYNDIYDMLSRGLVFVLATAMSVAFLNVCPYSKWFAEQGRHTMQFYIYHAFMTIAFVEIGSRLGVPASFYTATMYTVIIIAIIYLLLKKRVFKQLTNPSLLIKTLFAKGK